MIEQVGDDLGGALAGAEHGHAPRAERPLADVPVAGGVHDVVAEQRPRAGRHRWDAADAEHDRAGAMLCAVGQAHRPAAVRGRRDLVDARAEAAAWQPLGDPAVVGLELAPQDVQALVEVELVQPLAGVQVAQEGVRARRVGERHEVGEERHLDLRLVEHEAGVPRELRGAVEEDRVELRDAVEQRGQAEVERADADAGDVVRGRHAATAMRGARVQPSSTRVRSGSSSRAISSAPSARQSASIRVLRASGSQTIREMPN